MAGAPVLNEETVMEINEDAPGNISQKGVTSGTDNETGFDPREGAGKAPAAQSQPHQPAGGKVSNARKDDGSEPLADNASEVPLAPDDEAPVDENMADVEANNSVSSDHPDAR
jgi:hypothetical protein